MLGPYNNFTIADCDATADGTAAIEAENTTSYSVYIRVHGAKVALNLVVNYEEGSEYSRPAGDERNEGQGELDYAMDARYRDLGVESTYEYGSRAGVWRLLRLFDEYDVEATFFAGAVALELNPDVGEAIRRAGHEPCAHGWRWGEPCRTSQR